MLSIVLPGYDGVLLVDVPRGTIMGMEAIYVMISASELDDVLIGGMNKVETIFWKKRADKECWFLGSSQDDDQLSEDERNGFLWIDLGKFYRERHWSLTGQPFPEFSVSRSTLSDKTFIRNEHFVNAQRTSAGVPPAF